MRRFSDLGVVKYWRVCVLGEHHLVPFVELMWDASFQMKGRRGLGVPDLNKAILGVKKWAFGQDGSTFLCL